jgi:PPOX class probable F420-dependent enzyme
MAELSAAERDDFLSQPRYGILTTLRRDGSPLAVPVWFDWDGSLVRMFSHVSSPKLKRLARDPRASLLAVNNLDEKERWVAFDGVVSVCTDGGFELAARLAARYWDMNNPVRRSTVDEWERMRADWRLLELAPQAVRSYQD